MNRHFGFVVLDKPAGITSHDCVKKLRRVFGIKKIGHGGTLDPSVTGVLPIALGNATRLIPYLKTTKTYIGTIELGKTTDTDDLEGTVIKETNKPSLSESLLNDFLDAFRGEFLQRPPNYSSVHIQGERAYKKARRGEHFDIPKKSVNVHTLNLLNWEPKKGRLDLYIQCSSGTYIRSLARDLGEKIGCGAVLASLRRLAAMGFDENQAISIGEIEKASFSKEASIINPIGPLSHLSRVQLTSEENNNHWQTGRKIKLNKNRFCYPKSYGNNEINSFEKFILVLDQNLIIIGIGELEEELTIRPKVVFNAKG